MLRQIADHLRANPGAAVELRLEPAELGQLRFEIAHRGEVALVVLAAERPETLDLLRRHGTELLAELRAAGFAGVELSFSAWANGRERRAMPEPGPAPLIEDTATTPNAGLQPEPRRPASQGGLDLRL
jgi:hypothetical protein